MKEEAWYGRDSAPLSSSSVCYKPEGFGWLFVIGTVEHNLFLNHETKSGAERLPRLMEIEKSARIRASFPHHYTIIGILVYEQERESLPILPSVRRAYALHGISISLPTAR
jgi:hypothetical protein